MRLSHRYLRQFRSRKLVHAFTDVLIIGGGLAGLRSALEIPAALDVLVVTKDRLPESNSQYAQGGIAGVMDPEDRFENHVEDTLRAGAGICDQAVVDLVVRSAPEEVARLIEWGCHFDSDAAGKLALTLEGGHSHRRIVHALGDATGQEVMRAVIAQAQTRTNISMWEFAFTLDLLTHEGRCVGALVHRPHQGLMMVWAREVILASGGMGQIYRETTNPAVATGDGMAAAYRAGVQLADMEFMQFHPTVLYVAGSARYLISEAVRGEGAWLLDKNGQRFMPEVDPRAELAPRDIVARAIVRRMEQTKHPNVYLELSHLDPQKVAQRFPGIRAVCKRFDLDLATDRIPVRPASHYMIGGVAVDLEGRSNLPGLWAAGEVTSSGLHGANRLASNSLLEGLVFGARCGHGAAVSCLSKPMSDLKPLALESTFQVSTTSLDLADLRNSLQSLMGRHLGLIRTAEHMQEAEQDLAFWRGYVLAHESNEPAGWELQNMVTLASLMLHSAQERKESRGVHFRSDYPQPDDQHWRRRQWVPLVEWDPT